MTLKESLEVAEDEKFKYILAHMNEARMIRLYTALAVLAHEIRTNHAQLERIHYQAI